MPKAILIDLRRCTACRGCQVACKQWNELPAVTTTQTGSYENPPDLSANTWTVVKFREVEKDNGFNWHFNKWQCMHCLQPACVTVCPTGALYKTELGPVLYNEDDCIGCQYCVTVCPFSIPRFDWEEEKIVKKCTMCVNRITNDLGPACVKSCPPGALTFGERDTIMAKVNKAEADGLHVYGNKEVGGTSWIYISDVPFEERGFPVVGTTSFSSHSATVWGSQLSTIAVGAIALGLYSLRLRSTKIKGGEGK
jgi:formate dehydrogenase iron-sulfur subunit